MFPIFKDDCISENYEIYFINDFLHKCYRKGTNNGRSVVVHLLVFGATQFLSEFIGSKKIRLVGVWVSDSGKETRSRC